MELKLFLLVLVVVPAYLLLTLVCMIWAYRWAARRKFEKIGRSAAALAVAFLAFAIPFGDHALGYVHFSQLCEREGGTKIYRTVPKAEGFQWWAISSGQMALQYGYTFVEGGVDVDRVRRYEVKDGTVTEYKNVPSISTYVVDPADRTQPEERQLGIIRYRRMIADRRTGEMLAEHVSFQYRGGWLIRALLAGFGGFGAKCRPGIDSERFITSVLKPVRGEK